jgi:hypothetical protein
VASYHSTDTNPLAFNYYRVRVVDYDGSTTFSNTVELRREGQSGSLIVGPNPASDVLNVRVPGSGPYQWRLVDATGRTVANGEALSAQFSLQLRNVVATGTYVLQVQNTDGQRFQHRVVLR